MNLCLRKEIRNPLTKLFFFRELLLGSPEGTGFIPITSEGESLGDYKRPTSSTSDEKSGHPIPNYGMGQKVEDP